MIKKSYLLLVFILIIVQCGINKKNSDKNIDVNEKIVKEYGNSFTMEEIEDIFEKGKEIYKKNPEIGVKYFEKIIDHKLEVADYLEEYYKNKKDFENYEKWEKYAAEKGYGKSMFRLEKYYIEKNNNVEAKKWNLKWNEEYKKSQERIKLSREGQELFDEGKFEEAIEKYKMIEVLYENDINMLILIGSIYNQINKNEEAKKYFFKALEKNHPDSEWLLGTIFEKEKKYEEAEKWYLKSLERGKNKEVFYDFGELYIKIKKYEESKKYFLMAYENGMDKAMYGLGVVEYEQKNYDKSKEWLEKSLKSGDERANKILKLIEEK